MATAAYDRDNTTRFNLKLNNRTDADIIRRIREQESIQGYIKQLIRKDMEEEKNMTSRLYYRGSMVSSTVLEDMIANQMETADDELFEKLTESYRAYMTEQLEQLDDRLWWQPETSEVFWQDDGSGKELPDPDEFEDWWEETTEGWQA